ncbi:MAG: hypothetical protein V4451_07960 [Pseudomonadota bacterium]
MKNLDEQAFWAIARTDIKTFARVAFGHIYPGTQFLDNWHIDAILYELEEARAGHNPRLIINLPPRHLKSFLVSVVFPAFLLGHNPSARIIAVSYSDELAGTLARDFRRIVEGPWYRKIFPGVKLVKNTGSEVATSEGGYRYAISVGGSLTGRGADFFIIDDPIKPEDALSDKQRKKNNDWFSTTAFSRLDDKKFSVMILVMQRLHVNDLTGFIEDSGFRKISIPSIAREDSVYRTGHDTVHERNTGDILQPEREDGRQQYQDAPCPQAAEVSTAWTRQRENDRRKLDAEKAEQEKQGAKAEADRRKIAQELKACAASKDCDLNDIKRSFVGLTETDLLTSLGPPDSVQKSSYLLWYYVIAGEAAGARRRARFQLEFGLAQLADMKQQGNVVRSVNMY